MGNAELSLFYFLNEAKREGYVLWGEGVVRNRAAPPFVRYEVLGDGLRVMRVRGAFEDIATSLAKDKFSYRRSAFVTDSVVFGFTRRPAVMIVPPHPLLDLKGAGLLHHFVRTPKSVALGLTQRPSEGRERKQLSRLFDSLKTHVGVDFRAPAYAPSFGDVFIVDEQCLADAPLTLEGVRTDDGRAPEALKLRVDPLRAGGELTINVRLTGSDSAVLDDVLFQWRSGMPTELTLPVNQRFGGASVRAWRAGKLVWQTELGFILEVGLTMNLVGRTVLLQDRLTELLQGAIDAGNAPAGLMDQTRRVVRSSHASQSTVGASNREPWRRSAITGAAELQAFAPTPPPAHEYFDQGGQGRARAINAFVTLMNEKDSFLVDPFFDASGAEALLPRVTSRAALTILTSLPDEEEVARLRSYLLLATPLLPSGLKVFRVTRGDSGEQAFHDRYLVLTDKVSSPRGFLLSNSFSGAARRYPLVVAEMSQGTTAAVIDDIEALLAHRHIEALWPPLAEPSAPRGALGGLWRFYLQRLLPRERRTSSQWLNAAKGAGWLDVDADGIPSWSTSRAKEVMDRVLFAAPVARHSRRRFWLRRQRLPSVGLRVAALGEREARGLQVSAKEVASRLMLSHARGLERYLRASFRNPERNTRERGWFERVALHQLLKADAVTFDAVRAGLAFWSDVTAFRRPDRNDGRAFVWCVLLALDVERSFAVGVELGDPEFVAIVLDTWGDEQWTLAASRAALHSRSPMVRALGAQSMVAPKERGSHSARPSPPGPAQLLRTSVVLGRLDPATRAFCALEWGVSSPDDDVRRHLAGHLLSNYKAVSKGERANACRVLLPSERFVEALEVAAATAPTEVTSALADDLLVALDASISATSAFYGVAHSLPVADHVARLLLRASDGRVDAAKQRIRSTFGLKVATARIVPLSPFRRHPEWRASVARLAWAQLLFVLLHEHGDASIGVESLVPFALVHEVSPEVLARILPGHH